MSRLWRPQQGRPAARVPESGTQPLRDIDRNDQLTTWCVGPDRIQVGLSHAGHPWVVDLSLSWWATGQDVVSMEPKGARRPSR